MCLLAHDSEVWTGYVLASPCWRCHYSWCIVCMCKRHTHEHILTLHLLNIALLV